MHRLLLAGNAILALVLLALICWNASGVVRASVVGSLVEFAAWNGQDLTTNDLRLLKDEKGAVQELVLDLGCEMVLPEAVGGEPQDLGIQLQPEVPLLSFWRSTRQLRLRASRVLQPAKRHDLQFSKALVGVDGARVPAGLNLEFSTNPPRLEDVLVEGETSNEPPVLLLAFDMPVDLDSLRKCLSLRWATGRQADFELEKVESASEHVYRLALASGAGQSRVDLRLARELMPLVGDVPMGLRVERRVVLNRRLELRSATAGKGQIRLRFNRSVPLPAEEMLRLEPKVPLVLYRRHRGLELIGDFPPGQTRRLILAAGFPGKGRSTLTRPTRRSLLVPDLAPTLRFNQSGRVMSAKAEPTLELGGVNVKDIGVSLRRLYPNNILRLVQDDSYRWHGYSSDQDRIFAPAVTAALEIRAGRNECFSRSLDLEAILGKRPLGIFELRLWDKTGEASSVRRLLQVTDLGVTVRASRDSLALQVVSLASGGGVAGAEVQVVTPTNQGLVFGKTDAQGVLRLDYVPGPKDRIPGLVQVRKGKDRVFVDLKGDAVELTDASLSGRPHLLSGYEAYVFPSRGIVRPGEKIEALCLVRDERAMVPAGLALEVVFRAPGGRVWRRQKLKLPGSGMLALELQTAGSAPTGPWSLEVWCEGKAGESEKLRIGRAGFRVQAFVPDRLEAEIALVESLLLGAVGQVKVTANWLDGSAAAACPVELKARFDHGQFRPKGFDGFSFWAKEKGEEKAPPGAMPTLRGVLDEKGQAILRLPLPAASSRQALLARLQVEVLDPSGRAVHTGMEALVLRGDFHLGLRAKALERQKIEVEVVAVNAEGRLVPDQVQEVTVQLQRRRWQRQRQRVRRRTGRWRYQSQVRSELLATRRVDLRAGSTKVGFEKQDKAGGWLVAVALFSGIIALDSKGCCSCRFQLPDYEGRLRAMVLVSGPKVCGGSSTQILVRAPFSLQLAMPRMLMPGDLAIVPLTIKNHTAHGGEVRLALSTEGGLLLQDLQGGNGKSQQLQVPLSPGGIANLSVPIRAAAAGGRQGLLVTATLGAEQRRVQAYLEVRRPSRYAREFLGLVMQGEMQLEVPGQWLRQGLRLLLCADSAPDIHLRGALESLLGYPYGCLEQTSSKSLGLLSCRALLPRMRGDMPGDMRGDEVSDVQALLQAGVDRIFSMQVYGGGFGWWPSAREEYGFGTVHALDFLLGARSAGVQMPEQALERALSRLARIVAGAGAGDGDGYGDLSLRCHAIEVLSRAGRRTQPWLDFLAGSALVLEDRARLAMALFRNGQKAKAVALLQHAEYEEASGVSGAGAVTRSQGGMLRSALRSRALELRALLLVAPGHERIVALALGLTQAMCRPRRCTTQEKAQALRALSEYYAVLPAGAKDVEVTITAEGRVWKLPGQDGSNNCELPASVLDETIHLSCNTRSYGYLQITGQRLGEASPDSGDLRIQRRILDPQSLEPASEYRRGKVYAVELLGEADTELQNLVLTDLLPGGFELEQAKSLGLKRLLPGHVEYRDDRLLLFHTDTLRGEFRFRYYVRAVFPGLYGVPGLTAEAMYDPARRYSMRGGGKVEIRP